MFMFSRFQFWHSHLIFWFFLFFFIFAFPCSAIFWLVFFSPSWSSVYLRIYSISPNNFCGETLHHFSVLDLRLPKRLTEMSSKETMRSLSLRCHHLHPQFRNISEVFEKSFSLPAKLQPCLQRKAPYWLLESPFNLLQNYSGSRWILCCRLRSWTLPYFQFSMQKKRKKKSSFH